MTTTIRRATMACGAAVLGLIAATAGAAPAQAAARNGICESGEFCYYYNSYNQGSVSDFTASVADYGTSQPDCYEFKGPGAGQYQCIKNNAASVWNRSTVTVRVYYNSNYGGTYMDVGPGYKGQLSAALYNNNASHQFNPTSGGGGFSIGPFSIGGSYAHSHSKETFSSAITGGTIRVPGVQIIGVISQVVPLCPPV